MRAIWRVLAWITGAAGLRMLAWTACGSMAVALAAGLFLVPADAEQGEPQRLMYVHVPAAWTGYLAFAVVFGASIAYLRTRRTQWDRLAAASAEAGVVFTAMTIVLGALWGRPVWGTWWSWDPRLTTTLLLLLIYLGYLAVRRLPDNPARAHRWAAVVGVAGFLDVPIVHLSVTWWRSLHQEPSVLGPDTPAMPPSMLITLLAATVSFTLLYLWMVGLRLRLRRLTDRALGDAAGTLHSRVGPVVLDGTSDRSAR